jgi:hypothetical protein
MNKLQIFGMMFFSIIAVAGLVTANGITGNVIAGCDCISSACIKACGPDPTVQCCTDHAGTSARIPYLPPWAGYSASFIGLAGFFTILALNKKEEDMY